MNRTAQAAIAKMALPSDACDRKTYTKYIEGTIVDSLDFEECRALMAHYDCGVSELVDKIVNDRFANRLPKKRAGG